MNFFKKIFKIEKSKDNYLDYLNLEKFEREIDVNINTSNKKYVKIVTLSNSEQISFLKYEIYNGNILIIDISYFKDDDQFKDQFFKELKNVIVETKGDIVGIKENLIIITPSGIEIDRNKIGEIYNE